MKNLLYLPLFTVWRWLHFLSCLAFGVFVSGVFTSTLAYAQQGLAPVADALAAPQHRPTIDAAANGVKMVQIAAPDASGLSHNKYTQFHVPTNGLILNNHNGQYGQSQLGGYLLSNPNLRGGNTAQLILNEVTGTRDSQILGAMEVFGGRAGVIVANPNGITLNGANFLNVGRVTMTTGRPEFSSGQLGFRVNGGLIRVEGRGVDALAADGFDLISRAAEVTAEIHAKELNIISGRNYVSSGSLEARALADDGSARPEVAIDSSALGGMYAGKIRLVSTEKGVGVNMQGIVQASADDLFLQGAGRATVKQARAKGKVAIRAQEVKVGQEVYGEGAVDVQAEGNVSVEYGARLVSKETVELKSASGNITVAQGAEIASGVNADGSFTSGKDLAIDAAAGIENQGQIFSTGNLRASTQQVLAQSGRLIAGGDLIVAAGGGALLGASSVVSSGGAFSLASHAAGLSNAGSISSVGAATLNLAGALHHSGQLSTADRISIRANGIENQAGAILSAAQGGLIESTGSWNNAGNVRLGGQAELIVQNSGRIGDIRSTGGLLYQQNTGDLNFSDHVEVEKNLTLKLLAGSLQNHGTLIGLEDLRIEAGAMDQAGVLTAGRDLELLLSGDLQLSKGISAAQDLSIAANHLTNAGQMIGAGRELEIALNGNLNNQAGTLFSGGNSAYFVQGDVLNTEGNFLSGGDLIVQRTAAGGRSNRFVNSSGTVESWGGDIRIRAETILNQKKAFTIQQAAVFLGERTEWQDLFDVRTFSGVVATYGLLRSNHRNRWGNVSGGLRDAFYYHMAKSPAARKISGIATIREWDDLVTEDSAAAVIRSANHLLLDGGNIENRYSQIYAGGDIAITGSGLKNIGATLRRHRWSQSLVSYYDTYIITHVFKPDQIAFEPSAEYLENPIETSAGISHVYSTIEAGGSISGVITGDLSNSVSAAGVSVALPNAQNQDFRVNATGNNGTHAIGDPLAAIGSLSALTSYSSDPNSPYLIATDPAFTSLGRWLGSDYFLGKSGYTDSNPELLVRRLGDAFWESQYISKQIFNQTGHRFLGEKIRTDYDQMLSLFNNALTAQEDLQLTPGIALTAEQFNQLSENIVWMETRVVNGESVLVPQLYLAPDSKKSPYSAMILAGGGIDLGVGGLSNSGAITSATGLSLHATGDVHSTGLLGAGGRIDLSAGRDLNNSGEITAQALNLEAGRDLALSQADIAVTGDVSLTAQRDVLLQAIEKTVHAFNAIHDREQVTQQGISLEVGGNLSIQSGRDTHLTGTEITAGGSANLQAGRDLIIDPSENTYRSDYHGSAGDWSQYREKTLVGTKITADKLFLASGNDIRITASDLHGQTSLGLKAGGNVSIQSGQSTSYEESYIRKVSTGSYGTKKVTTEYNERAIVEAIGSSLSSGGDLAITSGGGFKLLGSNVAAEGSLALTHGGDITIESARESQAEVSKSTVKKSIGGISYAKGSESSSTLRQTLQGSEVGAGKDATLTAGKNITITASTLAANGDINLDAAEKITLNTATETLSEKSESKFSGFYRETTTTDTSVKFSKGHKKEQESNSFEGIYHIGSTLTADHVTLNSGKKTTLTNAAISVNKDISITAPEVEITGVQDVESGSSSSFSKFIGTYDSAELQGTVVELYNTADQISSSSSDRTRNTHTVGAAAKYGSTLFKNQSHLANLIKGEEIKSDDAMVIGVKASSGYSYEGSKENSSYKNKIFRGSTLEAGNDISIFATAGDATITGSTVSAGNDTILAAIGNILLNSGQSTAESDNRSSSNAYSGGLYGKAGTDASGKGNASIGVEAAASASKEKSRISSLTHQHTNIGAGNNLTLLSEEDILIHGAQAGGKGVIVKAAGDLEITSVLDTSSEQRTSSSSSAGISLAIVGTSDYSGNFSYQKQNGTASSAVIQQQSAILAGENGFEVEVGGDVRLNAGIIHGEGENFLSARDIISQNIQETTTWQVESSSVGIVAGTNMDVETGAGSALQNGLDLAGKLDEGESHSQIRHSGISAGSTIVLSDSGKSSPAIQAIQRDTQALLSQEALGTSTASLQATMAEQQEYLNARKNALANTAELAGDIASAQERKWIEENKDKLNRKELTFSDNPWREGGDYRTALHAATTAIVLGAGGDSTDVINGAVGVIASNIALDLKDKFIASLQTSGRQPGSREQSNLEKILAEVGIGMLNNAFASAIGQITGGDTGGLVANQYELNNRQLHQSEIEQILELAAAFAKSEGKGFFGGAHLTEEEAYKVLLLAGMGIVDATRNATNYILYEDQDLLARAKAFLKAKQTGTNFLRLASEHEIKWQNVAADEGRNFASRIGAVFMATGEALNPFRSDSSIRQAGRDLQVGLAEGREQMKQAPPVIREIGQFAMGVGSAGTSLLSVPAGLGEMRDSYNQVGAAQTGKNMVAGFVSHIKENPVEGLSDLGVGVISGGAVLKNTARTTAKTSAVAAKGVANQVPSTMARVIPDTPITRASGTLGKAGDSDVFVTAAGDIRGLNAQQISQRLTIPQSPTGFRVIEFPTPGSGVASPVFRSDPGFIGGGRTLGGAREFVIPNGTIPAGSRTTIIGP